MAARILIYAEVFHPQKSGYAHAFLGLIKNLLANHIQVDVLTPYPLQGNNKELDFPNLRVIRYAPKLPVWALGMFYVYYKQGQKIKQLFRLNQYDMLLIETGDQPLLPFFLTPQIRHKTAIRFHATSDTEYLFLSKNKKYKIKKWLWLNLAKNKVQHIWATSYYHLNFVKKNIFAGIQVTSEQVVTNAVQHELNLSDISVKKPLKFLMLGRMDDEGYKQKGFDLLLQALAECKNEFLSHRAIFTLIGNGKHANMVREFCNPLTFVHVIPELTHIEVQQQLLNADVVVLPSRYEGVSMFALEALQYANAVIFADTGGLADMVDGNGYLVKVNDVSSLKAALINMLTATELTQMKQKSLEILSKKHSQLIQFNQFNQGLKQIYA